VRPRGLFSFPTTVGTAGFVLSTNGNGTTSWVVQSGGGGAGITTIMQSKIVIDVNFGITSGYNGLSQGPVEIARYVCGRCSKWFSLGHPCVELT
jgi:hypothetical protein